MKTTDKFDPAIQCDGKHAFPTFTAAEAATSKKRDNGFQIYKCPHCSFFHIGHSTTKTRNLKRAGK
jgi:hypothetical protein